MKNIYNKILKLFIFIFKIKKMNVKHLFPLVNYNSYSKNLF